MDTMKTNVRETSLEAYEELQASGKHECVKGQILLWLIQNPGSHTRLEINEKMNNTINSTTSKVYELVKAGDIIETGKMTCPITGKQAIGVRAKLPDDHLQMTFF